MKPHHDNVNGLNALNYINVVETWSAIAFVLHILYCTKCLCTISSNTKLDFQHDNFNVRLGRAINQGKSWK